MDTTGYALPPGCWTRGITGKAGKKAVTQEVREGTAGSSKEIPPRGKEYTFN
jgi:hypothetical protein